MFRTNEYFYRKIHWYTIKTSTIRNEGFPPLSVIQIDGRSEFYHVRLSSWLNGTFYVFQLVVTAAVGINKARRRGRTRHGSWSRPTVRVSSVAERATTPLETNDQLLEPADRTERTRTVVAQRERAQAQRSERDLRFSAQTDWVHSRVVGRLVAASAAADDQSEAAHGHGATGTIRFGRFRRPNEPVPADPILSDAPVAGFHQLDQGGRGDVRPSQLLRAADIPWRSDQRAESSDRPRALVSRRQCALPCNRAE